MINTPAIFERHLTQRQLSPLSERRATASLFALPKLKRCCTTLILLALFTFALPAHSNATEATPIASEREIKAVYTLNFVRFTEWPLTPDETPQDEIDLAIIGDLQLVKILKGDLFQQVDRNVRLRTLACDTLPCIKTSDALYIDRSEAPQLQKLLRLLQNRPVLTISDIPGFAEAGGMIELKKKDDRMVFRINLEAIRRAKLYVSAKLLQLAEIIEATP